MASETVRIGEHDIEIAWFGRPDAEGSALVLLHEGLGSVSTWRDFPERLAAATERRVLAYSRYGYGRSTVRAKPFGVDYMHRGALEALPALLAGLEVRNPILVGHSDGASIAIIHAGAGRWPVRGLILEAPHVFTEEVCVESIAEIGKAYAASDDIRRRLARHHIDPDASFRGWNDVWLLPAFRDWNIEAYLPGIACPALVIQGRDDAYGTLEQVERLERGSGGPVERLILDRCGHAPHRDREDAVLEAMAAFVARLDD